MTSGATILRAQLLTALHTRFDAVVSSGDPAEIFAKDASAELEQLLTFLTNVDGLDIEVMYTLGLVHWLRAVTAEEYGQQETSQLDEARAGLFLLPLYLGQPDSLPDPVRASLAAATGLQEPVPGERKHDIAEALSNLAMFLLERFADASGLADGPTAVGLLRQAAFDLTTDHPSHAVVLCNLAYAILLTDVVPRLTDPSAQGAEPHRVDEVIALFRASLQRTPTEHQNYVRCVNGLGQGLRAKAILAEDLTVLAEAIEQFRIASDAPDVPEDNLAQILADLGTSLLLMATENDDPTALTDANTTLRDAVRLTAADAAELDPRLTGLAAAIRAKHDDIAALREMLDDPAVVTEERALLQGILGESLLAGETGREHSANVEEAVSVLRAAVAGLPVDGVEHTRAAAMLVKAMMFQAPLRERSRRRQEQHGGHLTQLLAGISQDPVPDKDDPLAFVARLLGMDETGGDSRHAQLMDFARTVLSYPSGAGIMDVTAKAMEMLAKQVEHLDPEQQAEAVQQFMSSSDGELSLPRLWDPASLAEIDSLYDRLDSELPADHEDRLLLRLGRRQLRMTRMLHAGGPPTQDRLDEMSATVTEAMESLPDLIKQLGEPGEMMDSMVVLGSALRSPFQGLLVVDEAVRGYRARLADDVPTMTALAHSLLYRFVLTSEEADYQEAAGLARRVLAASPSLDAKLVAHWGQTATGRARHTALANGLPDSDIRSTNLARMASNRATAAIASFDGPGALESLEDGRASMLSHALNTRHEVDGLRRVDPALAAEFVALRDEIYSGLNPGMEPRPGGVEEFRARARRWDALVNRIKALPGFDRFLSPLPLGLAELRPAAADGPVVAINVNPRRCDALVLGAAGVRVVPLPDLHAAEVAEQADAFHTAIGVVSTAGSLAGQANQVLVDTLAWLWDVVAEPILTAIGYVDTPAAGQPWPRLWWSPTGPLNFLPLHAAGRHDTPGASVIDRVVSSYTPTLRALLLSRSHPAATHRTALAVAVPETPGHLPLPATVREVAALTDRMQGPPPIVGPAATRDAVLAALPAAAVAHFACHAVADSAEPSASHLLLADGPLRITEISKLRLGNAELAYLSVGATARGGRDLADEAIHAAAAFQLAGYAQVVATLWEVDDTTAASVTARFYRELAAAISDGTPLAGAQALHTVTRELRAGFNTRPAIWAAYLHAGA